MGQYYKVMNLAKREYIKPHAFGDGAKLMEFGSSGGGTMLGLTILLASSNGLGGGDLGGALENIDGRWAGDPIAIIGDYCESNLYDAEGWTDISYNVLSALLQDKYLRGDKLKDSFGLDALIKAVGAFTLEQAPAVLALAPWKPAAKDLDKEIKSLHARQVIMDAQATQQRTPFLLAIEAAPAATPMSEVKKLKKAVKAHQKRRAR